MLKFLAMQIGLRASFLKLLLPTLVMDKWDANCYSYNLSYSSGSTEVPSIDARSGDWEVVVP